MLSQQPQFEILPEHADWWYQTDSDDTMLIFALSITNSGAPSVAKSWRGSLIVGGAKEELSPIQIIDKWLLPCQKGLQPVVILPENQIINKTVQGRLEQGEGQNGRLFLSAKGDKRRLLESLNWSVEITCHDFLGRTFHGMFTPHPITVQERKIYPGERHLTTEEASSLQLDGGKQVGRKTKRPKAV